MGSRSPGASGVADGSFEAREVALGATGSHDVEVAAGIAAGEEVATANAFLLKSEVLR